MSLLTAFSGNPLDRDDRHRQDPALLDLAFTDETARTLVMENDRILTNPDGTILWLMMEDLPKQGRDCHIFLGMDGEKRRYATLMTSGTPQVEEAGIKLRDARSLAMKLGWHHGDLGIIAQAKSILDWHDRHRFCAVCGGPTALEKAGYQRTCQNCGAHHFPRTDPVVIMLVESGDKILLGRGPKLPPGFYSALAGFIEPGETLEEAVLRELKEEAGVKAHSVQYLASQPWPWPSSLMMGCIAKADSQECEPDGEEIDSVIWLTRAELIEVIEGRNPAVALPPPMAIARTLIDHWIATKS